MRSAVLGAALADIATLRRFVSASTTVTHTDPKADEGAYAVALAAWCAMRGIDGAPAFFGQYQAADHPRPSDEFSALMSRVEESLAAGETTEEFAVRLGCKRGVSGYVYRTVPVVLHAWLRHPRDYRSAVAEVVRCGGDTDTTAAIVGALVGSGVGPNGIPQDWLRGLWEWPRSVGWMRRLAAAVTQAVESGRPVKPPAVFPVVGAARNAVFLAAVLGHGFRRLLPPY